MKFEKIKPGMRLYDVRRFHNGEWEWWPVIVKEVDAEKRRIFASWNYNAPHWMYERTTDKLRGKLPA